MSTEFAQALRQTDAPAQEQIQYIDIDRIDPDPANFYELSDVDKLAANIELIGLQQPLRVRVHPDDPERYMIVSGHRRRAAIQQLVEEGKEQYRLAQCIVEQAAASDALQELRLIYANSGTRRMTNAEISKQAERVEMLLYELKEQGMEFPGRMRDHVAEACKVSKSKLARLKVIREKLIPELQELFAKDRISEDAAYTAARESEQIQGFILDRANAGNYLSTWEVENTIRVAAVNRTGHCEVFSSECDQYEARMREYAKGHSIYCGGKCCSDCSWLPDCNMYCKRCEDKRESLLAMRKEKKEKELEEHAARRAEIRKELDEMRAVKQIQAAAHWKRFGERRKALGLTIDETYNRIPDFCADEDDYELIEDAEKGTIDYDALLWEDPLDNLDTYELGLLADQLQCSVDYLLGRSEAPEPPVAQLDSTPVWHDPRTGDLPEEGQEIIAAVQYCPPNGKWTTEDLTFRGGVFVGFGVPLDEGIPLYWQQRFEPPVPDSDTEETENEEELN